MITIEQIDKLIISKNYKKAVILAKKLLEETPNDESILSNLCEAHIFLNEYDEANSVTNKMLLINIDSSAAYFYKGIINKYKGDIVSAKENFNLALNHGYNSNLIWRNLATIYENEGNVQEAILYLDKSIMYYSKDIYSRIKKLKLLLNYFMYPEALKVVSNLIFINSSNEELYKYKCLLLYSLDKKEELLKFGSEALKVFPNNIELKRILLLNRLDSESPIKILNELNTMIKDSNIISLKLLKGMVYLKLEKDKEAMQIFDEVFIVDQGIFREEAGFQLMLMHTLDKSYKKALYYVEKILEKNTNSIFIFSIMFYKPMLLEKLEDKNYKEEYSKLINYFEKEYKGNRYFILMYLAMSYIGIDNFEKALEIADEMEFSHDDTGEVSLIRYYCAKKAENETDIKKYSEIASSKNPIINQLFSNLED